MNRVVMCVLVALGFSGCVLAEAADKKTERQFNSKCGSCHGKDGKAETAKGRKMKMRSMASPEFQKGTDKEFRAAIMDGFERQRDGVEQSMDGYKEELSAEEVEALIQYIRGFK